MSLYLDSHKDNSNSELVDQKKEQLLISGKYFIVAFAYLLYLLYSGLNLEANGGKKPLFFLCL